MTHALTDDLESPRITRAVQWLIAINVAIYFLQLTIVGADNMKLTLGFTASHLSLSGAWWTVLTYMFVHGGFWHLVLNMYTLWLFGPRLEHAWSPAEFTRYYILCGLGGWLFHLLFAREGLLIGASAAVLGVMLAYAVRWPGDEVLLFGIVPIKVKWLVAALAGVNLLGGIVTGGSGGGGGVAYLAHLGGLAAGWVYLRSSTSASISRFRQRVSQLPDLPDETPRAIPRTLPRARERGREIDDIVARSNAALGRRTAPATPLATKDARRLTDLNDVLDKISEQGIDSLTSAERRLLEEMSKELRKRE
jgi:membrane associated rhomboid family serine protease